MTDATPATQPSPPADAPHAKPMDAIMALCKRRGFVYQASEIYGGIQGFWDYGPLGAQLKKNLRDAWWTDVVMKGCNGQTGPNGAPVRIVPIDTCIIQNPKVWEASGHVGGFNDPMVDCKETKNRYRADHLMCMGEKGDSTGQIYAFVDNDDASFERALKKLSKYKKKDIGREDVDLCPLTDLSAEELAITVGPDASGPGTLTEPRAFNLMFDTITGPIRDEANKTYLRPETAQGIFINFKNVVDTTRVSVPFGIAQTGKAFRNEVTPRNFTFRSREFEQMEIEFFCHEDDAVAWYQFWRDWRLAWWKELGLSSDNLIMREHDKDELAHYAKTGAGTADVEYRFPFTFPGYGELEGVAHRSNFDLTQHEQHSGAKLKYFDQSRGELAKNGQPKGEHYLPHVIEPSAGLDRGVLAILCEAYTVDENRPSPEFMKIHPRLAPIKAAVFPLVRKGGMPELANTLHQALVQRFAHLGAIEYDARGSIGKRYASMDEAGCPFCFTIDGESVDEGPNQNTVTVRDRDTGEQTRIAIDAVGDFLASKLGV